MSADIWYYTRDGKSRLGPFSFQQLAMMAKAGQLLPSDMVRHEGAPRWQAANQFPGLCPPAPKPGAGPGVADVVAAGVVVGAAAVSALAGMNNPGNVRHPRLLNLLQEAQALHKMGLLTAAEFVVIRDIVLGHGAVAQPAMAQPRPASPAQTPMPRKPGAVNPARGKSGQKILQAKKLKGDFKDEEVMDAVEVDQDEELLDETADEELQDDESGEDADDVDAQDDVADDLDESADDEATDELDDSTTDESLDDMEDPDPLGDDMADDLGDEGMGGDDFGGDADLAADDAGGADFGGDFGGGGFDFGGGGGGDE